MLNTIVSDYRIVADIPPTDHPFNGNSAAAKEIIKHVFPDNAVPRTVLDIGFGIGELARTLKTDPSTQHWHVDGIDGFAETCRNVELFKKGWYRNVWHGLAQDIPAAELASYDVLCLFDVIEHLDADTAKQLLKSLLAALGENSRLVISTPLWFYPQDHNREGDLEEHLIGVPGRSMLAMQPAMYLISSSFLIGNFVFTKDSLQYIDAFQPTTDRSFGYREGMQHLAELGVKADNVLKIVGPQPGLRTVGSGAGAGTAVSALNAAHEPRLPAVHLYQIAYSPATRAALEPGYLLLDNRSNERPDWYEYWPIRRFLMNESLDENAFYGFFSTKFGAKTQLSHAQVTSFVRTASADHDVMLFSPQPDMGAFFLNVFEQGETFDPGLMDAAEGFLQSIGRSAPLRTMVMDSSRVVFSNYFVARPAFWREWLRLTEAFFAVCEGPDSVLKARCTAPTTYPNEVQRKVFIQERMASLLLSTQAHWRVKAADPFGFGWSQTRFRSHPHEAVVSDALKTAYLKTGFPEYLLAYGEVRQRFVAGAKAA